MSGDVTDQGGLQMHSLENHALKSGCDFLYNVPSDGKCASQAYKINHSDLSTDCVAQVLLTAMPIASPNSTAAQWFVQTMRSIVTPYPSRQKAARIGFALQKRWVFAFFIFCP